MTNRYSPPGNAGFTSTLAPTPDLGEFVSVCISGFEKSRLLSRLEKTVSGQSKPAREGQMKTSHFESGIAHGAAIAALMRNEPTQREPATFGADDSTSLIRSPKKERA
jgi:hypothetical protein